MNLRKEYTVLILVLLILTSCIGKAQLPSKNEQIITPSASNINNQNALSAKPILLHTWVLPTISDMKWLADGNKFVVVLPYMPKENHMQMYDSSTYEMLWDVSVHRASSTVVFSSDDKYIYNGLSFPIGFQKRNTTDGNLLAQGPEDFNSQNERCYEKQAIDVVLSKDNTSLFFLVSDDADKQVSYAEVQAWDAVTFQCKMTLMRVEGHARSLAQSPDGKLIAVGVSEGISDYRADKATDKGHTIIYDIEADTRKCTIPGANSVFMPKSNNLIVFESGADNENKWINRLTLWDAQSCQFIREVSKIIPAYYYLSPFSITSDGKILAIGQRDIKILDLNHGIILAEIKDPSPQASDLERITDIVSFSPDGSLLLYSTPGKAGETLVNLWKIERNK